MKVESETETERPQQTREESTIEQAEFNFTSPFTLKKQLGDDDDDDEHHHRKKHLGRGCVDD